MTQDKASKIVGVDKIKSKNLSAAALSFVSTLDAELPEGPHKARIFTHLRVVLSWADRAAAKGKPNV